MVGSSNYNDLRKDAYRGCAMLAGGFVLFIAFIGWLIGRAF